MEAKVNSLSDTISKLDKEIADLYAKAKKARGAT